MESTHLQTRRSQRSGVNSLYKSTLVPSPSISFTSATSPAGIALSTPTRLSNDNAVNTIDETNNIIVKLMERLDAAEVVMSNNNKYVKKLEFRIHHLEQCIIYKKKETNVCENKNVVVSKQPIKKHKESTAAKSFFDIPLENRFESLTHHEEDETTTDEPITNELVGIDFNIGTPITTKGRDVNKTNKKLYSQTLNTANLVKPPQPMTNSNINNIKPKIVTSVLNPTSSVKTFTSVNTCEYSSIPTKEIIKKNSEEKEKKKVILIGDSHVKRINKELFNFALEKDDVKAFLNNFDGATSRKLNHHILPTLHEEQPDMVIIHVGTNDINEKTISSTLPIEIAKRIINIGNTCKRFGIRNVAYSSILPRKDQQCQKVLNEVTGKRYININIIQVIKR